MSNAELDKVKRVLRFVSDYDVTPDDLLKLIEREQVTNLDDLEIAAQTLVRYFMAYYDAEYPE